MTTVAGIDLAGKTTGHTVVALASGQSDRQPAVRLIEHTAAGGALGRRPSVRALADVLADLRPEVVAIDAPLSLPHPVVCTVCPCPRCDGSSEAVYTQRAADRKERWVAIGHRTKGPMPTVMLAPIAFRGIHLRRMLERTGLTVIETWPAGVAQALGADGPMPAKRQREEVYVAWCRAVLARVGVDCPAASTSDEIDAVLAAVAAWMHLRGETEAVGDPDEGLIWVPLRR